MVIMYLSQENFACPKQQIMHKELSLVFTVLKPYKIKTFLVLQGLPSDYKK